MSSRESLTTDAIRLISQLQPALLAYILTLHRNHTDAQDILQETNDVLWQKISLFQEGTSFIAGSVSRRESKLHHQLGTACSLQDRSLH